MDKPIINNSTLDPDPNAAVKKPPVRRPLKPINQVC